MTFLEALQWMSESEDNLCKLLNINYKVIEGKLKRQFNEHTWLDAEMAVNYYTHDDWRKLTTKKKITFHEVIYGGRTLEWRCDRSYMADFADEYEFTGNTKEVEIENG